MFATGCNGEDFSLITKIEWHLILACFVSSPSIFVCTFWVLIALCSFPIHFPGAPMVTFATWTNKFLTTAFLTDWSDAIFLLPQKKSPRKIDKVFPFRAILLSKTNECRGSKATTGVRSACDDEWGKKRFTVKHVRYTCIILVSARTLVVRTPFGIRKHPSANPFRCFGTTEKTPPVEWGLREYVRPVCSGLVATISRGV